MLPVIIGAVATFVFGFLWYGPLFGKQWMKLSKITPEQMADAKKKSMAAPMLIAFVMALVGAGVVHYLFPLVLALSFGEFFKIIFIIWLGFTLPIMMNGFLWGGKSLKLVLFEALSNVISLVILSAIVFYWV
jgi:hypothetical protein